MRRHVVNLVLLFCIGALAAFVWMKQEDTAVPLPPLVTNDRGSIERVSFVFSGASSPVRFARTDSGWRLRKPVDAPVDPAEINGLLAVAGAEIHERIPVADVSLADLGLDRPELTLTFNEQRVAFGATNPVTHQRYVRIGDAVAQIDEPSGLPTDSGHARYVDKRLVPPGRTLQKVTLPDWILERSDGAWRARSRDGAQSAAPARAATAGKAWTELRAMWMSALPSTTSADADWVTLQFADGTQADMEAVLDQQLLLRRADFQAQYHVARDKADMLLRLGEAESSYGPPGNAAPTPESER